MIKTHDPSNHQNSTDNMIVAARLDALLDDALMHSFPASDPIAITIPAVPRRSATPEQRRPS